MLLSFKLLVRNNQVKIDNNLITYVEVNLATVPNFIFMKAISRFLILIILGNYKSNIAKVLRHIFFFTIC